MLSVTHSRPREDVRHLDEHDWRLVFASRSPPLPILARQRDLGWRAHPCLKVKDVPRSRPSDTHFHRVGQCAGFFLHCWNRSNKKFPPWPQGGAALLHLIRVKTPHQWFSTHIVPVRTHIS